MKKRYKVFIIAVLIAIGSSTMIYKVSSKDCVGGFQPIEEVDFACRIKEEDDE